jgi:hypothetical protein
MQMRKQRPIGADVLHAANSPTVSNASMRGTAMQVLKLRKSPNPVDEGGIPGNHATSCKAFICTPGLQIVNKMAKFIVPSYVTLRPRRCCFCPRKQPEMNYQDEIALYIHWRVTSTDLWQHENFLRYRKSPVTEKIFRRSGAFPFLSSLTLTRRPAHLEGFVVLFGKTQQARNRYALGRANGGCRVTMEVE